MRKPNYLTVGEVALRLCQRERTVRDKIASGQLPAVKIGTGLGAPIRVDPGELEQWLESSHVNPAERRAPCGAVDCVAASGAGPGREENEQ